MAKWRIRKNRQESIVKKLFRSYLIWVIVCILGIQAVTLLYVGTVVRANITDTQRQLTHSLNQNIDNYFQSMDDFSMELVKSDKFYEAVRERLPDCFETGQNMEAQFADLYMDAYKMIRQKYHIGVIVDEAYYIWMGREYYIDRIRDRKPDFYQDYVMDGTPDIRYMAKNEYLQASMGERTISGKDSAAVTLSRSFGRDNLMYNGSCILEVQVDAREFAEDILKLSSAKKGTGIQIHILNAKGDTIFSESGRDGKNILQENGWKEGTFQKNGHFIYTYQIFNSQLYVLYTISLFDFYREILGFLGIMLIAFLIILLIMAGVSRHVSLELSRPILKLCEEMERVDPEEGRQFQMEQTNIREMDFLSDSIRDLDKRLSDSRHRMITLKEYEAQARMMALQAQMQPHFLVNTLTTMGTMAEQGGCREVFAMCMNLTQMFRYIASGESNGVKLYEEIRHVERYVDIMKERFPQAEVEIEIPLELMGVRIPKLVIQPLVENSFKYCNRSCPEIWVTGSVSPEGIWSVKVSDNGEGFSEEKKAELLEKCRESMGESKSLETRIDGMGLVNVYARLRLFYGENAVYIIDRDGITIGGKSHEGYDRSKNNGNGSGRRNEDWNVH